METSSPSCDEYITGTIHEGQSQGIEEFFHGLNTYIIGNCTTPKEIIVIYSDKFGLFLPNNKSSPMPSPKADDPAKLKIADLLTPVDTKKQSNLKKYTDLLASAANFVVWMTRHKGGPTTQFCMDFLEKLRRATAAEQKIGMVRFFGGGKYAIRASLESNMIELGGKKVPLADAVVGLHPSHLTIPGDVERLVVPVSFGWGQEDTAVSIEQKAKVESRSSSCKGGEGGQEGSKMEYRVVRGNPDDFEERACKEDPVTQALERFGRWS